MDAEFDNLLIGRPVYHTGQIGLEREPTSPLADRGIDFQTVARQAGKRRQRADLVAQASSPASSGSVSLPVPSAARSRGGTPRKLAAGTAALRAKVTPPNAAEIIGIFGGADPLRNAVNQLQTLLYAA